MGGGNFEGAVTKKIKGFKKIYAVSVGMGVDHHGQDPTVAAVRAIQSALAGTSLPVVVDEVPGGYDGAKIKAKVSVPNPGAVDVEAVKKAFPFGKNQEIKVVGGGQRWHSGIIAPRLGDPKGETIDADTSDDEAAEVTSPDEFLVAVASVRIGA